MDRLAVSSSALKSIGYDAQAMILEIEREDGSVFQYLDVPSSTYEALMMADSKGKYFNSHVKPLYKYNRVKYASPLPAPKALADELPTLDESSPTLEDLPDTTSTLNEVNRGYRKPKS